MSNLFKKIIGVTGITGSGTTTVAGKIHDMLGATSNGLLISADKISHDILLKGGVAYEEVVRAFGRTIMDEQGEIDRKVLGSIVFRNAERLKILEAIVHPGVKNKILEMLVDDGKHTYAVLDVPLLVESDLYKVCTSVVLVTAPDEIRTNRIVARDGISTALAKERIRARQGDAYLQEFANHVVHNTIDALALGTNALTEALEKIVKEL